MVYSTFYKTNNMNAKIIFDTTDTKSGIYEIVLPPAAEPSDAQQILHIMIDVSGSMDERCKDRNTKLDQIKYVTKNIIRFLGTHCPNISLCVSAFNTSVSKIFSSVVITSENMDDLLKKIEKMYACDSTNIEDALKALRADPSEALRADPSEALRADPSEALRADPLPALRADTTAIRHNILMTDGDANEGETRSDLLAELVDVGASNTFIGFGLDHNPHMFTTLSNTRNSSYYFIDQVEKAGIAYGEILHGIVNRVYKCARVVVENGEIYDWKTGDWTTELYIGALASDATKKYHIRSEQPTNIVVRFMEDQTPVCDTGFQDVREDLTQMSYRLRTLKMLYRATHADEHDRQQVRDLKKELKALFDEMKDSMKTLKDKVLMKNLCDDIVVVHRTIGTKYGQMYSSARQCSQGMERIHNASDTPMAPRDHAFSFSPLTRQNANTRHQPDYDDDLVHVFNPDVFLWGPRTDLEDEPDAFVDYTVSGEDTPYTSRTATCVIRDISETCGEEDAAGALRISVDEDTC
jgi:hypothetical protein